LLLLAPLDPPEQTPLKLNQAAAELQVALQRLQAGRPKLALSRRSRLSTTHAILVPSNRPCEQLPFGRPMGGKVVFAAAATAAKLCQHPALGRRAKWRLVGGGGGA